MIQFTNDEMFLLAIYEGDTPKDSILKMEEILPFIHDPAMQTCVTETIIKLKNITDSEYLNLEKAKNWK